MGCYTTSHKVIHWVNWEIVCRPMAKGGLRVKDLAAFNEDLLLKWKWRFLSEKEAIWKPIIDQKYSISSLVLVVMGYEGKMSNKNGSIWWRDLSLILYNKATSNDLFVNGLNCILCNDKYLAFWHCKWALKCPLKGLFPNLFIFCSNSCCSVAEMGNWGCGRMELE
ncbi:unnamed protein product [Lathyrus sativus]|nr:unnamed protein product [Lathyrus sativus]